MRNQILLLAAVTTALVACHGNGETYEDAVEGAADCALHDDVQTYAVGLEVMGEKGLMNFSMMDAMPAPPARNNNTWMVKITATGATGSGSGSGSAVAAGSLVSDIGTVGSAVALSAFSATPYMPDHGHGTSIEVIPTNEGDGMYELTPVNLWMPGY